MSANQELLLLTHDVKDEHMVKGMFKTSEAAWDYRQNYIMCHTILYNIHKGFCKCFCSPPAKYCVCACVCVGGGGWVGGCDE